MSKACLPVHNWRVQGLVLWRRNRRESSRSLASSFICQTCLRQTVSEVTLTTHQAHDLTTILRVHLVKLTEELLCHTGFVARTAARLGLANECSNAALPCLLRGVVRIGGMIVPRGKQRLRLPRRMGMANMTTATRRRAKTLTTRSRSELVAHRWAAEALE